MPASWRFQYFPVNAISVPFSRSTRYCSGVSCFFHSSFVFTTLPIPDASFDAELDALAALVDAPPLVVVVVVCLPVVDFVDFETSVAVASTTSGIMTHAQKPPFTLMGVLSEIGPVSPPPSAGRNRLHPNYEADAPMGSRKR